MDGAIRGAAGAWSPSSLLGAIYCSRTIPLSKKVM